MYAIKKYIYCSLIQIGIIALIVAYLRYIGFQMDYSTPLGMGFVILGGCSTALWGIIISIGDNKDTLKNIIKNFFNVTAKASFYPLILLFLFFDFCPAFFGGNVVVSKWYYPILVFLKAIAFGGIEEIGWRYTLQPMLEKKFGFFKATISIFALWGIWHWLYFYIEGTLSQIEYLGFYTGLLTNCFILGMIYKITKSLWLCVFTHAAINTLSQIVTGGSPYIGYITKVIIIMMCVCIVLKYDERLCDVSS